MRRVVLTIPLDSPRSPFSITPNNDVIIIHYRTRVKVQRRSIGNHPSFSWMMRSLL